MDAPEAAARLDLGDARPEELAVKVGAYDAETGIEIADDISITLIDERGHQVVQWAGRRGPLALDGRTALDLAAAGETVAGAYDRYLRDTAIQDALQIDHDGS
ncbi:hypothetical protein [Actinomadura rubrisoli]|uniref:Uncharacterized protein n=1 Tax=Actinomadura rubrisoli TaxID=2530368 RepID=A0A4R5B440_9ACTN|nr:hypothetical protein [Actinomadura rubrisoli]TDD79046.1 hypothetical protein E1298_28625 [Actinomadura rubrisoli]